jgi:hypothetical protein
MQADLWVRYANGAGKSLCSANWRNGAEALAKALGVPAGGKPNPDEPGDYGPVDVPPEGIDWKAFKAIDGLAWEPFMSVEAAQWCITQGGHLVYHPSY